MRSICGVSLFALCFLTVSSTNSYAVCDYGADTCLPGYVWREAFPGDHVCVTGATRDQARVDNSLAAQRRSPNGPQFGPGTCLPGFFWRNAAPGDDVCVPQSTVNQTVADNAQAAARRDPQCAGTGDQTPPAFIQNSITFYRVTDGLQVGSQVISTGATFSVPDDRRFVIASTAGDNESGVANIHLLGTISVICTDRLHNLTGPVIGTISTVSDEERNYTAAAGNPLARTAHFTIDPLDVPRRSLCPCTNDSGPLTVGFVLVSRNGNGVDSATSPPGAPGATVTYAGQGPTCGAASGEICGNNNVGQVLTCADGRTCDFKRSTVCSGWWIFRHCDQIQTTDMFCP